jgi:hypothetical protein
VRADVGIAQTKPGFASQRFERIHSEERIVAAPPAGCRIFDPCERVHDRIQVRADVQAVDLFVVAGVNDNGELIGRQNPTEPEDKLCSTDTTREREHPLLHSLKLICEVAKEQGAPMATNNGLDDRLIEAAVKAGGHRRKKEAVTEALREYLRNRQQLEVLELIATIEYDSNYDHKAERRGC